MQQIIFIADLIACSTCLGCLHTTLSSTPYRQLENQSTKYDRQQPLA